MRKKEPETPQETPPFEDDFRTDLIPGSQALPDRSLFRERLMVLTPARVISLVVVIGLLCVGWLLFAGPGKSAMENLLSKLAERISTPTEEPQAEAILLEATATAIPSTPTSKPGEPSQTPTIALPSQTATNAIPSQTPLSSLIEITPTSTLTSVPATPTVAPSSTPTLTSSITPSPTALPTASIAGCVQAAAIKTTDVGKTLCVTGHVLRTESKPSSFLIILENPKEAFYFLSYDRKWETLEEGKCVFATGKIMQLGNNPVMILDYKIPLEYCP
jgi:hypothetical protein